MPPTRPDVIGKYSVERFIESGGMGDVYLARDPVLDRPVAIKFLREGFDSQEMRERFEREARAAGRLSHPNIVTIYEFGEVQGRPFIAMEFVRGEPLAKLIRRREPLGVVRKLEMMEGLCAGLAHAHKAGIVHRDVKPANLMVDLDGGPLKILDFGIVRMAGSGLTSHGVLVGTVNYMSPEQISGRGVIDHRSDVFAVGAVLHELFTYQRAFPGEMTDVLYKIVHTQPASAASLDPTLDPGIVRAIDICLQKAPEHRYQDLGMLRRDLARIRQRLELEEQETTHGAGHSVATMRGLRDVPSHPSHQGTVPTGPALPTPWVAPPPSTAPKPAPPPQTSPSERARREAAAAEQARLQREAEEARLEQVRQEHLRQEQIRIQRERAEAEQREREKIAREREAAERARVEAAERARAQEAERARAEEAERARIAAAQAEQARIAAARAEQARIAAAQAEQARLDRERRAREQAERDRAAAEQRAREEAQRQAEARRQQRQRDLAQAQQAVAAGRFAEALDRLRPSAAEAAGDKVFAEVWREAEAGVARVEAERREREAIAAQLTSAAEALAREDFAAASRLVQAVLRAQPGHGGARTLERDIVHGVELRARAVSTVERARGIFDGTPGEALESLERFSPSHPLVDAALAELRTLHATRERQRQLRERRERLRANVDWTVAQAAAVARNRVVQISAAVLVVVVVLGLWLASRPDPPAALTETTPPVSTTAAPTIEARREPPPPASVPPRSRPAVDPDAPASPDDGVDRRGQAPAPTVREIDRPERGTRTTPAASGSASAARPTGVEPTTAERVEATPPVVVPPAGDERPAPVGTNTRVEPPTGPTPEPGGRGATPAPPAPPDPIQLAKAELQQWIADYRAAFRALDERRVKQMNPQSPLDASLVRTASVEFLDAQIVVEPDGKTARLRALARYEYSWKRSGLPPVRDQAINWRMSKVGDTWVANR